MEDMLTLLLWCGYNREEYISQRIGGADDWEELELQQQLDDPDCVWQE